MARIIPQTPQRGAARNLLSVVDTYYAPARDRMGEAAMVNGIKDVSKTLGSAAQAKRKEEITEVKIQAQQDAMVGDDPDEELTKVRMGGLFRGNSRAYNQVYNETLGKQAAIEFQNKAALDYEKSGMKRSTDPNRFREWMNERVDGFLSDEQSQNPYFLAGAMPYVQQATHNMSAAHTSNISAQMERNHLAAIQTQANDIALKVANGEIPIEEMLGHVTGINSQGYSTGLAGPKVRKATLSALLSVADATRNKEIVDVLLSAQNDGSLRVTPKEWVGIVNQGEAIQADIDRQEKRQAIVDKANTERLVAAVEDAAADFYLEPDNASVSIPQFLSSPVGDTGQTMGEMIAASPDSTQIMKRLTAAHKTLTPIHEISTQQEEFNNYNVTNAYRRGEIRNGQDLQKWMQEQNSSGNTLNEANIKHAFAQLATFTDPERSQSTDAYKTFYKANLDQLLNAMNPTGDPFFKDIMGNVSGDLVPQLSMDFETAAIEYVAAIPVGQKLNPKAIREALEEAQASVLDRVAEQYPDLYNQQLLENTEKPEPIDMLSPQMSREAARRLAEKEASLAAKTALLVAAGEGDIDPVLQQQLLDADADAANDQPVTAVNPLEAFTDDGVKLGANAINEKFNLGDTTSVSPEVSEEDGMAAYAKKLAEQAGYTVTDKQANSNASDTAARQASEQAAVEAEEAVVSTVSGIINTLNEGPNNSGLYSALDALEMYGVELPTNGPTLVKFLASIRDLESRTGLKLDPSILEALMNAAQTKARQ